MSAGTPLQIRDESGEDHRVTVSDDGTVTVDGVPLRTRRAPDGSLHIEGSRGVVAWSAMSGNTRWVFLDGAVYTFDAAPRVSVRRRAAAHGGLAAPMPATVRQVHVAPGDHIARGDLLVVLEAMKMELPIRAPADGIVTAVNCREGDMVQPQQMLVDVDAS